MNDEELLQMLENNQDRYNCGMIISNSAGFSLIQAHFDTLAGELEIDPTRYWHDGAHPLEGIVAKYRHTGYRVEYVGQDDGNIIYTVIRQHLILSSETLIRLIMHWMYP